jgi:hypothetical protein
VRPGRLGFNCWRCLIIVTRPSSSTGSLSPNVRKPAALHNRPVQRGIHFGARFLVHAANCEYAHCISWILTSMLRGFLCFNSSKRLPLSLYKQRPNFHHWLHKYFSCDGERRGGGLDRPRRVRVPAGYDGSDVIFLNICPQGE